MSSGNKPAERLLKGNVNLVCTLTSSLTTLQPPCPSYLPISHSNPQDLTQIFVFSFLVLRSYRARVDLFLGNTLASFSRESSTTSLLDGLSQEAAAVLNCTFPSILIFSELYQAQNPLFPVVLTLSTGSILNQVKR